MISLSLVLRVPEDKILSTTMTFGELVIFQAILKLESPRIA